jgi:hypothetical protein
MHRLTCSAFPSDLPIGARAARPTFPPRFRTVHPDSSEAVHQESISVWPMFPGVKIVVERDAPPSCQTITSIGRSQTRQDSSPASSTRIRTSIAVGSRTFGAGLANVGFRDSCEDFAFIVGERRFQCRSSVARFLSPRFIRSMRSSFGDPHELFCSVFEAVRSGNITVGSTHLLTFVAIFAVLWNSGPCEVVCVNLGMMLRWRMFMIVFDSWRRLAVTFPENSNSSRHSSTIFVSPRCIESIAFSNDCCDYEPSVSEA